MVRLAGLIIARDEAALIEATVRRFRAAAPRTPVCVVADRCTDATAAVARAAGARVLERAGGAAGKGQALAWAVHLAEGVWDDIDGVLVLDADSAVIPGAVERLAAALGTGSAAQAFVMPQFEPTSPVAVLAGYSEWLSQALDDRLRRRLGWSVPFRGTGMALRLDLLRRTSSTLRTRTEDVELTLLVASAGAHIQFVPDAVVLDPKPAGAAEAWRQRARWLQGQREILWFYWRDIIRLAVSGGPAAWFLLSALLMKPRTAVMLGKGGIVLLLDPAVHPAVAVLRALFAVSLGVDVLRYAAGILLVPTPWRRPILGALLRVPVYVLVWLKAAALSIAGRGPWYRARD